MITHHGICMDGGHYTCDIFNSHQWLECNDEQIVSVSENDILQRNAYLLFYQRM